MSAGLYIHFPFCKRKCHYCDFYSLTELSLRDIYIDRLCNEINLRKKWLTDSNLPDNLSIDSIFIGGGTPSLLLPEMLEKIFNEINSNFVVESNAEITLECNPGAADSKYFKDYRSIGINRLSIGVQSFDDNELKFLQRIHNSSEAAKTIEFAQSIFDNISIDLIFAIPGQSLGSLMKSLERAVTFGINHISCYSLIFEESTPLFDDLTANKVEELDEISSADMYEAMCNFLIDKSYAQYEISNFAKSGFESRHNKKYWSSLDVIAFGPSAVGNYGGVRYKNHSDLSKYSQSLATSELPNEYIEKLDKLSRLTESVFLSLRSGGLNLKQINAEYGINLEIIAQNEIQQILKETYASLNNGILKLSPKGYYICDEITLKFLKIIEDNYNV